MCWESFEQCQEVCITNHVTAVSFDACMDDCDLDLIYCQGMEDDYDDPYDF